MLLNDKINSFGMFSNLGVNSIMKFSVLKKEKSNVNNVLNLPKIKRTNNIQNQNTEEFFTLNKNDSGNNIDIFSGNFTNAKNNTDRSFIEGSKKGKNKGSKTKKTSPSIQANSIANYFPKDLNKKMYIAVDYNKLSQSTTSRKVREESRGKFYLGHSDWSSSKSIVNMSKMSYRKNIFNSTSQSSKSPIGKNSNYITNYKANLTERTNEKENLYFNTNGNYTNSNLNMHYTNSNISHTKINSFENTNFINTTVGNKSTSNILTNLITENNLNSSFARKNRKLNSNSPLGKFEKDFMNSKKEFFRMKIPLNTENYKKLYSRTPVFVNYNISPNKNREQLTFRNMLHNLSNKSPPSNYDPDKILHKINNYKKPQLVVNFDKMLSRK